MQQEKCGADRSVGAADTSVRATNRRRHNTPKSVKHPDGILRPDGIRPVRIFIPL